MKMLGKNWINWTLGRGLGIFRERKEGSGWEDDVWIFGVIGGNLAFGEIFSPVILFDVAANTINIEYYKEYYSLNILIDIITESDFNGDNTENWATLMQRKLAIG
ncbi:hypothetical protein K0M31_008352 [Melipona bicolor]|uniref:Uncharacterized protein n=1 Tax=Melipona bicolor TaxID=60889 RepID=A0AA40KKI2_9HYME|nr:hypothetical protein K0M31_008352 [Melipona bicolor]